MKTKPKKTLVRIICKKSLQPLMNRLYLLGVTGMNYGNANTLDHFETGEKWVINYISNQLANEKEIIVFDVGANAGNYALLVNEVLNQKPFRIFAFEPSKPSFGMLVENTISVKNIEAFNFGFGEENETIRLYSNYEASGATTLYNDALKNYSFNKNIVEDIFLKKLDEFCDEHSVRKIDFLKIDVEGHELPVLLGARGMLESGKIRFIQFEFGPFHIYSKTFFRDFWNLLSPLYTIYRIIRDGLFEIREYSENLEIFRTANFLAELK